MKPRRCNDCGSHRHGLDGRDPWDNPLCLRCWLEDLCGRVLERLDGETA